MLPEPELRLYLLSLLLLNATLACPPTQAEQRRVYTSASPPWLQAVGKLRVPGSRLENGYRRHQQEDCSGTLVSADGNPRQADVVVTAWHCLEHYHDLSRPIVFTLLPAGGTPLVREARRVASGGGMAADWALLQLTQAVATSEVRPLRVHWGQAGVGQALVMAGYSGDTGLGADGEIMTYHWGCRVTAESRAASTSDCEAYKGASGGAVIQLNADGEAQLAGVISQGDGDGVTIFVPVAGFRGPLRQALH